MTNEPRSTNQIYFDPDEHPEDTLKSFEEFVKVFGLRYDAQYPDPPKVSLESAIERWKITHTTADDPNPKPNIDQYDKICLDWRAKDKVTKLPFIKKGKYGMGNCGEYIFSGSGHFHYPFSSY